MLDANGLEAAAKATFAKANEGNLKPETIESLWPSQHLPHWSGLAEAAITAYLQAVGPEPATWEYFCDRSYFDMWCVRQKDAPKVFGDGYHVMSEAEAKSLAAYLNSALVATPPAERVVEAQIREVANLAFDALFNTAGASLARSVQQKILALATKPAVKDDETVVEALLNNITDVVAEAEVDFPAGRYAGARVSFDEDAVRGFIRAALAAKDGRS